LAKKTSVIPIERIAERILLIRGRKVMVDSDLADLYGVATNRLNEQVKRNINRFPSDFMFQLDKAEFSNLKSQIATSSSTWGGRRKLPYAFTEHGAVMAASVLNSKRAVEVSIYVVRAFIKLRQLLATHKDLAQKLQQFENKLQRHDKQIAVLYQLMSPIDEKPKTPFGFHSTKTVKTKRLK